MRSLLLILWCIIACYSVVLGQYQKVTIKAAPDAVVWVNGLEIGEGVVNAELPRKKVVSEISTIKDGYKDRNILAVAHKSYDDYYVVPPLVKLPQKGENQKFLWVNEALIDKEQKDFIIHYYTKYEKYESKEPNSKVASEVINDINYNKIAFSIDLNNLLMGFGFADTTKQASANATNSLLANAKITQVKLNLVEDILVEADLEITWEILDYSKKSVYQVKSHSKSDAFSIRDKTRMEVGDTVTEALKDALMYDLIKFMDLKKTKELLIIGKN